jgi:hypothetical protein
MKELKLVSNEGGGGFVDTYAKASYDVAAYSTYLQGCLDQYKKQQ